LYAGYEFNLFSFLHLRRKNENLPVCKNTKNRYKWKPEFDEQPYKWFEYQFTRNKKSLSSLLFQNGSNFFKHSLETIVLYIG